MSRRHERSVALTPEAEATRKALDQLLAERPDLAGVLEQHRNFLRADTGGARRLGLDFRRRRPFVFRRRLACRHSMEVPLTEEQVQQKRRLDEAVLRSPDMPRLLDKHGEFLRQETSELVETLALDLAAVKIVAQRAAAESTSTSGRGAVRASRKTTLAILDNGN